MTLQNKVIGNSNDILNQKSQKSNYFYNNTQLKKNSPMVNCVCRYVLSIQRKKWPKEISVIK